MPINFASASPKSGDRDPWLRVAAGLLPRYKHALDQVQGLVPVPRWNDKSVTDDRYLDELGEYADSVITQLLKYLRDDAENLSQKRTSELCMAVVELQQVRSSHRLAIVEERLYVLESAQRLISRVPGQIGVRGLLERAAVDVCELPGLSRSMVFQRDEFLLHSVATHFTGNSDWAQECQAYSAQTPLDLGPSRPEAEVIRRRTPAVVIDAMDDPNTFQPIVRKIETHSYVLVPITAYGEVVATLHADAYFGERTVDEVDRDAVAAFATSLGHTLERAWAIEQLRIQKEAAEQLARSASAVLNGPAGLSSFGVPGNIGQSSNGATAQASWERRNALTAKLSRREGEVLQLLTTGAANAEIARNLFVAEDTVKAHVKRILRKLGASNRGQAVAIYLDVLSHQRL
jgi:DNA-binding CsgD family transcriptional regulator/GAF domain-containing protein